MIALNPDGVQRHQDEWRVSPLDDPESKLRELTTALAQMTECDWKTPGCKKCQSAQTSQRVGIHWNVRPESFLQLCRTRSGQ